MGAGRRWGGGRGWGGHGGVWGRVGWAGGRGSRGEVGECVVDVMDRGVEDHDHSFRNEVGEDGVDKGCGIAAVEVEGVGGV